MPNAAAELTEPVTPGLIGDEALAIFRFQAASVNPEYGSENDGTFTQVYGMYTSSDVLWGSAPSDTFDDPIHVFQFVVPGGTLWWDETAPRFDLTDAQFYPGETYLGFFFHGSWHASPSLVTFHEFTDNGKTVYVTDGGGCLMDFDADLGPVPGPPVTDPLPIWGPLWDSERLIADIVSGDTEDEPDDEGYGSYALPLADPSNWDDNFENCPTTATINSAIASIMSSYSPASTTWISATAFDWTDGGVEVGEDDPESLVCWVDYNFPYTCEDTPSFPERNVVGKVWDAESVVGHFTLDDDPGAETLFDASGGSAATVVNEEYITLAEPTLLADQGSSVDWGTNSSYAELGQTRWNYIHQTGEFTILLWVSPSGETQEPILASSQLTEHKGFRIDILSGALRAIFTNGSSSAMITSSTTLTSGTTYFVAVTGNGSNYAMYVNGVAEGSTPGVVTASGDASNELRLGRYPTTAMYFEGTLDDLVFLDVGATSDEIRAFFDNAAQQDEFDIEATTDLDLWIDVSAASTMWTTTARTANVSSDNDPIQVIEDLSGNDRDLTYSATAPTYQTAGFKGEPTARFAGGNHEWRISSLTNATPQTLVFVGRNDDATYGFVGISGGSGAARTLLLMDTSPVVGTGPGFHDGSYTPFHTWDITPDAVYVVVFDDDETAHLYVDGMEVGPGVEYAPWSNSSALFRVGGAGGTADYDLSELRIYDRALKSWEVRSLTYQLREKWDL